MLVIVGTANLIGMVGILKSAVLGNGIRGGWKVIQQTSLEAYETIVADKSLSRMQRKVFECVEGWGPITNKQVSAVVGLPINCVTPRMGELVKLGKVKKVGVVCANNGKAQIEWGAC